MHQRRRARDYETDPHRSEAVIHVAMSDLIQRVRQYGRKRRSSVGTAVVVAGHRLDGKAPQIRRRSVKGPVASGLPLSSPAGAPQAESTMSLTVLDSALPCCPPRG